MIGKRRPLARRSICAVSVLLGAALTGACGQSSGPFTAFDDRGSAADVRSVRSALPSLIEREDNVGRVVVDDAGAVTAALNLSAADSDRRRAELEAVAVPKRAAVDLPLIESGIADMVTVPETRAAFAYTAARFQVAEFLGIDADDQSAHALVSGSECYTRIDATESCSAPARFRVELVRAPSGEWLIASKQSRLDQGTGP